HADSEGLPAGMSVGTRSITALLPIMGAVLIAFLVIGVALPVLPLHVHQGLGLSTFVVGLVTGSQVAASLITRVWAGRFSDVLFAKTPLRVITWRLSEAVRSGRARRRPSISRARFGSIHFFKRLLLPESAPARRSLCFLLARSASRYMSKFRRRSNS